MYPGVSKKGYMKYALAQNSIHRPGSPTRTIVVTAMILFALSGLISGFAVGAFIRPKILQPTTSNTGTAPSTQNNQTPPPKVVTQNPVPLGFPMIDNISSYVQVADGTTAYTFSAHAVDQSKDKGHGKTVHASGITCRLWLVDTTQNPTVPMDRLKSADTLGSAPLPGEIPGLVFDPATPQTLPCNDGAGTWKYTLAPSIPPASYYLVVLTDWKGLHYNWSWIQIRIKQAGQ